MRKVKLVSLFVLLALLLSAETGVLLAQGPPPVTPSPNKLSPSGPQPLWWGTVYAYNWENPSPGEWLAVWRWAEGHDQHYVPGDWQTCGSGYGCIGSWTWWETYPKSKLGVPSHWRSIWPGAKNISNYTALCWVY